MVKRTALVDINTNLLIIGKGGSDNGRREISYAVDEDKVNEFYGEESDLAIAYRSATEIGAKDIFLMNLRQDQDYFDVIEALKQNEFAYVAFASLLLSDTFQDVLNGNKVHSMLAYLLGYIGPNYNSTFVITDKHASLYEGIDDFISSMRLIQTKFLGRCSGRANLENVIFVANNLKDYKAASIPLAASLCATEPNVYSTANFGDAIFHIDQWDQPGDMAYFRRHVDGTTTIENGLNMLQKADAPEKIIFIDRILKILRRDMDFTEFKGRQYTKYQKLLFRQKLEKYLNSVKGYLIVWYKIISVEAYHDQPGTVVMVARIEVQPVNCLEVCTLKVEVEV